LKDRAALLEHRKLVEEDRIKEKDKLRAEHTAAQ